MKGSLLRRIHKFPKLHLFTYMPLRAAKAARTPTPPLQFPTFQFMVVAYVPNPVYPQEECVSAVPTPSHWMPQRAAISPSSSFSRWKQPNSEHLLPHSVPQPLIFVIKTGSQTNFCDPSVKLAFNPEQHSATEIAFQCAHKTLPPSLQTGANGERLWHAECQLTLGELGRSFSHLKGSKSFSSSLTSHFSPKHQEGPHHGRRQLHKRKASVLLSLLVFDKTNIIDCQRCVWRQGSHDGFHYCVRSNVSENDGWQEKKSTLAVHITACQSTSSSSVGSPRYRKDFSTHLVPFHIKHLSQR